MANLELRDIRNQSAGSLSLDDEVFGAKPKTHVVYEEVKRYLASLRGGTHSTKTRAEVQGAGRKLWKQKGTGRARMGSIRSPLWRHGGISHGPHPHDYDLHLPRKVKKLAMRVVLSSKLKSNTLVVLDSVELPEARTRHIVALLNTLGLKGETLFVAEGDNLKLRLAARNHPDVKVVGPTALSVYDVLHCRSLVLTRATAAKLTEIFKP